MEVRQVQKLIPASEVKQKARKIAARIEKLQQQLADLKRQCDHEGAVVEKSHYFPGGYLNTSYTDYWNECEACGTRSEVQTKDHGHYG